MEAADKDEAAEQMLRHSLELDSTQREAIQHLIALRQRQCEWPVVLPSERVEERALIAGLSPLSAAALSDDPLLQLAVACRYNRLDVGDPAQLVAARRPVTAGSAPLRVGYLSSDLREHAVGYLMTEVLGLHDRGKIEVFAYYCGPESKDPLHQHFKNTAQHFTSITSLDDTAAARRIADDGVQILVDLNGYTREARLKLVAQRPAPVIVNWLGFPGSMASPYHHYLIADEFIVPESHELYIFGKSTAFTVLSTEPAPPRGRRAHADAKRGRSARGRDGLLLLQRRAQDPPVHVRSLACHPGARSEQCALVAGRQ